MKKNILLLVYGVLSGVSLFAQAEVDTLGESWEIPVVGLNNKNEYVDSIVRIHDSPVLSKNDFYARDVSPFDADYTGYAIELIESDYLLKQQNPAFSAIGKVYYVRIGEKYSYLFPVNFYRRKSIKKYFFSRIRPMQPNAKVVRYLHGTRTTTLNW